MTNYKLAFILPVSLICGSLVTAACAGGASAGSEPKTGNSIGVAK